MKNIKLISTLFFFITFHFLNAQTFLSEDFENGGTQPDGWVQIDVDTAHNGEWVYQEGGYSGNPPTAHSGSYNALFHFPSFESKATMLITPPIDISGTIEPQVSFYHAQREWFSETNDELRIYYKVAEDSNWVKLDSILGEVYYWTEQVFDLPEKSSTLYIGFEATTKYGLGVCIDDVMVYESAVIPMHVKDMSVSQASDNFVYNGSENNPILATDIYVYGNSGNILFNSAVFHSKNIDNSDIELDGVKLYSTRTNVFTPDSLICPSKNFTGDSVVFDNINMELPNGHTYIWLTYDVDDSATEGNTLDAKLLESRINISDTLYPSSNQDPPGERSIFRVIYADDFEEDKPWYFSGEFERDTARGKGGVSYGFSDPAYAYSGKRIIGTDISGQGSYPGDYEPNLSNREDSAVSPPINCYFYRDIYLRFFRQLNIDYLDRAYIDVSNDNGQTWNKIWESDNSLFTTDNTWKLKELGVSNNVDRDTAVRFRFSLGTTDASRQFSGWNIDDFIITGDLIEKDIALGEITYPLTSCGLGEEQVSVWIKNTGKNDLSDTIPLSLQIKKGIFLYDSLKSPLNAGDSVLFTFPETYDFIPGNYNLVMINNFGQDEYSKNDTTRHSLYSLPTYSIPYTQNFETDTNFWLPYGENCSWELGTPAGNIINYAFSGENSWVTSLDTFYKKNEASYLESPCFDLYGVDYTLAEFSLWYQMEKGIDGLSFQYSTDGGSTWDTVGHKDERWNWFNSDTISSLDSIYGTSNGWTDTSGGWITARHILPEEVKNHSSVKFRFVFANIDTNNQYEGIAIDDIVLREPPPDVGIVELIAPDSACELSTSEEVIVALENFGADTLESGFQIPVGIILNNEYLFTDTITLAEDLIAKDTMHYTFNGHVDVWNAGNYEFKTFTDLQADENLFSEGINTDTNTTIITVYGMPNYTLGPDIGTTQPDTVVLDAGAGYVSYFWNGVSTGRYFNVPSAGKYSVVVTNDYACTAEDTILIAPSYMDLGVTDLLNIESDCYNSSSIYPEIEIKNYSLDTLLTGDTVFIGYMLNEEVIDSDSLILSENFYPDSTIYHTFDEDLDMSSFMDYDFRFYTAMQLDIKRDNDTLYTTKNTWGPPPLNLGEDIYTTMADTIALAADTGYVSYLWQDGSTNDTLLVSYPATATYSVNVEDIHSCQNSDTITIYTYDIAMQSVDSPVSSCALTNEEYINTTIQNLSQDTLSIGTPLFAYYTINDTAYTQDSIALSQVLYPDSTLNYTFNESRDFSLPSIYEIETGVYLENDADTINDTTAYSFEVYGLPTANIGPDTIFTSQADTIIFTPGTGFTDYLWQDSSVNDTFYVNYPATAKYHVLITDANSCQDRDTSIVITYDIGIQNINQPISSCELSNEEYINIDMINLAADTLFPGTEIAVSYSLDDTITSSDTIVLAQNLYPDSLLNHIFAEPVNLSIVNDYELEISIYLENDVEPSNDTLFHTISVYGYPSIDLGPDTLYTTQADTVVLAPGNGYDSYLWQDSSTNDSLYIDFPGSATYFVSVENEHNCQSNDTITIVAFDIGVQNVLSPVSSCELSATEIIQYEFANTSEDTIPAGTSLQLYYTLNDTIHNQEVINLPGTLYPDSIFQYSFSQTADFSATGNYSLETGVAFALDADSTNNSLTKSIEVFGFPDIDLGPDTLITAQPDTLVLDPGSGYSSYTWQDGSTTQTYTPSGDYSSWYKVTVTNSGGCPGSDSIFIYTNDVAVSAISSPVSACELSSEETITVELFNNGPDTVREQDELILSLNFHDFDTITDTFVISNDILPGDATTFSFDESFDMSAIGGYNIKVFKHSQDVNNFNDTLNAIIYNYGYPTVDIGPDTILTSHPDTILLDAGQGFATYLWQDGTNSQTYDVEDFGIYWVIATDSNGCSASDTVTVKLAEGIKQLTSREINVKIYPNPVKNILHVQIENHKHPVRLMLQLFNNASNMVWKKDIFVEKKHEEQIDFGSFSKGVYYLRIAGEEFNKIIEVVK